MFDTVGNQRENLYKRLLGHYESIFVKVNAVRSDSLDVSASEENFIDRNVTTLSHPTPHRTPLPPNKIKEVHSGQLPLAKFPDAEKYI